MQCVHNLLVVFFRSIVTICTNQFWLHSVTYSTLICVCSLHFAFNLIIMRFSLLVDAVLLLFSSWCIYFYVARLCMRQNCGFVLA